MVNPIILGGGKALFKDVKERHSLKLLECQAIKIRHGNFDLAGILS